MIYLPLVRNLAGGTRSVLASQPRPDLLEYVLSHPPVPFAPHSRIRFGSGKEVTIDDMIFSGQVLVTGQQTLTIAGWWLLIEMRESKDLDDIVKCPSTSLLRAAYRATKHPGDDLPASLFGGFCVFFVAEAMRRGGKTLRNVAPFFFQAGRESPGQDHYGMLGSDISIEQMASVRVDGLAQPMEVIDRVKRLKSFQTGGKCTILIMPPGFPSLDAIIVGANKVVGLQFNSKVAQNSVETRINTLRQHLQDWKDKNCDILGPEGLIVYIIGLDVAPDLQLSDNEHLVTAAQLRMHFLDVFFCFGLTSDEGKCV
jgi:hypothetical protein